MDNTELTWKIASLTERLDKADIFLNTLNDSINKLRESKIEIDDRKITHFLDAMIQTMDNRIKHHEDFIKKEKNEIERYYGKIEEAMEKISKIDITKYLAENKFIGKRLFEIEKILLQFKEEGIKRKVHISCSVDDKEMIERPKDHVTSEEESEAMALEELLEILTPRERNVVIHRIGLQGNDRETLEGVALKYKVTKERIRQIERIAYRKLKRTESRKKLIRKTNNKILIREILNE
jgi:hypothetical protein